MHSQRWGPDAVIDAHHHVWDPATRDHSWLADPALASVRRPFTVADLAPHAAAAGVRATVLVQVLADLDETEQAIEEYQGAINLNSYYDRAYLALGITLLQAARLDEAEQALLSVIKLSPANSQARYFLTPTPGALNTVGAADPGPLIIDAGHTPDVPFDNQDLLVTARVLPAFNAVSIADNAGSPAPPINSTTQSISGCSASACGLFTHSMPRRSRPRFLAFVRAVTATTRTPRPLRADRVAPCCSMRRTTSAPTVPSPAIPTFRGATMTRKTCRRD